MELPNTSLQAVEFNPTCLGQAHFNRPGAGPGYKHKEHECVLTELQIPFIVCTIRSVDAKSSKIV